MQCLRRGPLPITGKTDGWYQILCNGRTGYVSAEFVTVEDKDSVSKPDGGNGDNSSTNPLAQQIVDFALQYVGYPTSTAPQGRTPLTAPASPIMCMPTLGTA